MRRIEILRVKPERTQGENAGVKTVREGGMQASREKSVLAKEEPEELAYGVCSSNSSEAYVAEEGGDITELTGGLGTLSFPEQAGSQKSIISRGMTSSHL